MQACGALLATAAPHIPVSGSTAAMENVAVIPCLGSSPSETPTRAPSSSTAIPIIITRLMRYSISAAIPSYNRVLLDCFIDRRSSQEQTGPKRIPRCGSSGYSPKAHFSCRDVDQDSDNPPEACASLAGLRTSQRFV